MPAAISRPHRLAAERLDRDLHDLEAVAQRLAHPCTLEEARHAAQIRVDLELLRRVADALGDALVGDHQDPTVVRQDLLDLHVSVARLVAAVGPEPAPRQERRTA